MTDSAPTAEVWNRRSLLGKLGGALLIWSGTVILLVMPGTDRLVRLWFELLTVSWPWMLGLGCIAGGIALWRKT